MKIKVQKWGNSLALRIPKAFAVQTKMGENQYVNLSVKKDKIIIEPEKKEYKLENLVSDIKKSNIHNEINTGDKVGNEIW